MAEKILFTGDDIVIPVQLTRNNATFVIDPGATVRAALIDVDGSITGPVAALSTDPGNDWTTSYVQVTFPTSITGNMQAGPTVLEVEVNDGGITTWQDDDFVTVTASIE